MVIFTWGYDDDSHDDGHKSDENAEYIKDDCQTIDEARESGEADWIPW